MACSDFVWWKKEKKSLPKKVTLLTFPALDAGCQFVLTQGALKGKVQKKAEKAALESIRSFNNKHKDAKKDTCPTGCKQKGKKYITKVTLTEQDSVKVSVRIRCLKDKKDPTKGWNPPKTVLLDFPYFYYCMHKTTERRCGQEPVKKEGVHDKVTENSD